MKYTIFDIAHWFLNKQSMNQRKLQKLCYYAQSWYLALYDKPLFNGDFEAWVHGPVNKEMWNRFKSYGYLDIPTKALYPHTKSIDDETISFLERIWATYGEFSGYQLELLSHSEEPWIEARKGIEPSAPSNEKISNDTMRNFYIGLLGEPQEGVC